MKNKCVCGEEIEDYATLCIECLKISLKNKNIVVR